MPDPRYRCAMEPDRPADLARRVARLLRHEVGDFLQGVYSTLAVLQSRLGPAQALEQRLASDLRRKAELVRSELDAVVTLLAPSPPQAGVADLAAAARAAAIALRRSHPETALTLDAPPTAPAACDPSALGDAFVMLFAGLAGGAKSLDVKVVTEGGPVCILERQGAALPPDLLSWLDTPFATTQQGLLGLALALCVRVVSRAGGLVEADARGGSVTVRLSLPAVQGT